MDMYDLPPDQKTKLEAYATELERKLVDLIGQALTDLKPARLTQARAWLDLPSIDESTRPLGIRKRGQSRWTRLIMMFPSWRCGRRMVP